MEGCTRAANHPAPMGLGLEGFGNNIFLAAIRFGGTPVPIPNTKVKAGAADGTALETMWESRWLPETKEKGAEGRQGLSSGPSTRGKVFVRLKKPGTYLENCIRRIKQFSNRREKTSEEAASKQPKKHFETTKEKNEPENASPCHARHVKGEGAREKSPEP